MKTIIITLLTLALGALSQAQNSLKVEIQNISEAGTMYIGVFDSQEQFDQKQITAGEVYQAKGDEEKLSYSFDLPDGNYGVAIYQVTSDTDFAQGNYGVYGFSNSYAPREYPQFAKFSFELNGNHEEMITLQSN